MYCLLKHNEQEFSSFSDGPFLFWFHLFSIFSRSVCTYSCIVCVMAAPQNTFVPRRYTVAIYEVYLTLHVCWLILFQLLILKINTKYDNQQEQCDLVLLTTCFVSDFTVVVVDSVRNGRNFTQKVAQVRKQPSNCRISQHYFVLKAGFGGGGVISRHCVK